MKEELIERRRKRKTIGRRKLLYFVEDFQLVFGLERIARGARGARDEFFLVENRLIAKPESLAILEFGF